MRSIPGAMLWETFSRGLWLLIGGVFCANALSLCLLAALRTNGPIDPNDPSMITMHIVLVQVNMFLFGAAIFSAQGSPSRLFTLPITTATIVTWHVLPTMLFIGLEVLLSTLLLNTLFHLNWPLWGPALFAAVAMIAVQAAFWLTEKSFWVVIGLTVVGGALGIWFKSRYGAPFGDNHYFWRNVEPAEVFTLLALAILAYRAGIVAVARNRRSEPPVSIGIVDFLQRTFDDVPTIGQQFRNPVQAQFWYEWRQKGWAMPMAVVFGLIVGICCWLLFSRYAEALLGGCLVGGGMLSVAALVVGLMMGNCGPNDASFDAGPFFATRPLTTPELARTILKVAAWSTLAGWVIWLTALGGVYLVLWATNSLPGADVWENLGWWYFPATLLGPWIVVSMMTTIGLAGRSTLFAKVFCGAIVVPIAGQLLAKWLLSDQAILQLLHGVMIACGIIFLLGTVWSFVASVRCRLIGWSTIAVAVSLGTTLIAIVTLIWTQQTGAAFALYVLLLGLAALTVAPFATAPLALEWNRRR